MKKRLFFLTAALLMAVVSFAQPRATVEKLWSGEPLGWGTADTRQWTGHGEYVYWESKANHTIYGTHDGVHVDTIYTNAAIDGTAFCVDDAGNFIVEGIFPSTASHLFLLKHDTTAHVDIPITGLGRTDIVTAKGDVFSEEGGFVFLYGNSVNLLVLSIKNAATVNQEVTVKTIAIAGSANQNFVVAGDTTIQYVQRRSSGQTGYYLYEDGEDKGPIAGMTGYKYSTLGGAMVTLSGQTFAIYPVGSVNYSSEFAILNMTTGELVVDKADNTKTSFCANTTTRANGTNIGVFVNATKIDEYSAYIQVGNGSDGTALFKLTVPRLYEIGDNNGWAKNPGVEMEVVAPNVYEGVFTFPNATSFFTFATVASDDWDGDQGTSINENRWGAPSSDCAIADGETKALVWQGTNSFAIAAGKYRLTVDVSNPSAPQVTATAIPDIPTVSIAGLDGWDVSTNVLEDANDHLTASKSIHLTPNIYEFKVVLNGTAWYTDHNAPATSASTDPTEMNRANSTGWVFDKGDGYKNTGLRVDLEGDYEFVYTYATKELSISGFPTSFTRTVTAEDAEKYQTLCVPFDATVSGATVYEFDGATETGVTLNAVASDALEAGKSYLILPEGAGSIVVSAIPAGDVAGAPEELHGLAGFYGILGAEYNYVYAENDFATYVLQNDNKFHKIIGTASATITSTHAYLHVAGGIQAPALRIIMGATDINNVEGQDEVVKFIQDGKLFIQKNGVIYNAFGAIVK